MQQEYGLFIGRFQPYHDQHKAVTDHIIASGRIPIFCLGSTQENRDLTRNPMTAEQRIAMIRAVHPDLPEISAEGIPLFLRMVDKPMPSASIPGVPEYGAWFDQFRQGIFREFPELPARAIVYYGGKESDNQHFTLDGVDMGKTHYTACFRTLGMQTVDTLTTPLDATRIREEPILGLRHIPAGGRATFLNGLMDAMDALSKKDDTPERR